MQQVVEHREHHHDDAGPKVVFGFWIYLMTDFILFASLFATYIVLKNNTYGGPNITQVTSLPHVLLQTVLLLTSTFTYGLSYVGLYNRNEAQVISGLVVTFLLGFAFTCLEFSYLHALVEAGITWQVSGFLSAYFSLITMFSMHLVVGLVWIVVLLIQLLTHELNSIMHTRLSCLSLFWNFLSIVWIIIFTVMYLMGAV